VAVRSTGRQTGCTIWFDNRLHEQWLFVQPVVKPVSFNRLSNWFDNRLYRVHKHSTGRLTTLLTTGCMVYTAGCQTGCTIRFDNRLNEQWLFVQPVIKPVSFNRLSNWLSNQFDNRLDNLLDVCLHDTGGCQTGLYNRFNNRLYRENWV